MAPRTAQPGIGWTPPGVVIQIPSWMWGGDPERLLTEADMVCRRESSERNAVWRVRTGEDYRHAHADLVQFREVAGPGRKNADFDQLTRLNDGSMDAGSYDAALVAQVADRAQRGGQLVDFLNYIRLQVATVPASDLARSVAHHFDDLGDVGMEGEPATTPFANRGMHIISRSTSLLWRLKIPSILHRFRHDPQMQSGELGHVIAGDGSLTFQSSSGLADGAYLMDVYLGPLLAAMTPLIWAVNAPRAFGSIVISLGQPLAGTTGDAAELLQLIHVPGSDRAVPVPQVTASASGDAVRWWADSLNNLFAVVSDVAVFADRDQIYQPHRHLHAILSVEQLFQRVTSSLVSDRDTNARRVLMFTALDTLERLTSLKLDKYADLVFAEATLERLEQAVWPGAAEILLPAARRAVAALKELQDGFFLRRQLGREVVEISLPEGTRALTLNRAGALYVKALRDATHGHGSHREQAAARTNALLAHHNGKLPHDLGLLAYLYLLDLLMNPARLRRVLTHG